MKKALSKMNGLLEMMTIDDVRDFNAEVVVIPIGSPEPHGPHIPYGTVQWVRSGHEGFPFPRNP